MPTEWVNDLKVTDMDDGGMGSLRLSPLSIEGESRRYGRTASELRFEDADGVTVLASLYLDRAGAPFELDIWKVDFSPLIRLPDLD